MKEMLRETEFVTYGGPAAESSWNVAETAGGFLISADSASFGAGKQDAYFIRTDAMGRLESTRTYGDFGSDTAIGLCPAGDGGFISCGGTTSYGNGEADAYVMKVDGNGEMEWDAAYGGANYDYAYSAAAVKGAYFITGYTSSFSKNPDSDVYLIKIDKKGVKAFERTFGGANWESGYSVASLDDGGCVIAGYTDSYGNGKSDMYLIRADAKGNCVWARTFGGIRDDRAYCVIKSRDNNIIISGKSGSYNARGFGWDMIVMKVDMQGNSLWSRVFPAAEVDVGMTVANTSDGGLVACGTKKCYGICDSNVYVIKMDAEGNTQWSRIFAGKSDDAATGLCVDKNGNYAVTGTTLSYGNGLGDVFLLLLDKNGEIIKK
jgi:hypothetical protein